METKEPMKQRSEKGLLDKLFVPAMWVLSVVAAVLATVVYMSMHECDKHQHHDSQSYLEGQTRQLKSSEAFLNVTVKDYVVTEADTALIEFGDKMIQNLEQMRLLSPYDEVREGAAQLRDRYLAVFPMCRASVGALDFRTGDIVVRHNNSLHSDLFRNMSVGEKKYSHLGIIEYISSDSIVVHHSVANDLTGIGGIQTYLISQFMPRGDFDVAVYRISEDPQVQHDIVATVHNLKARNVPFDMMFDIADSTRMYCAEMVAHAVNRAMHRQVITPSGTFMGRPIITIEDCYRMAEAKRIYNN